MPWNGRSRLPQPAPSLAPARRSTDRSRSGRHVWKLASLAIAVLLLAAVAVPAIAVGVGRQRPSMSPRSRA